MRTKSYAFVVAWGAVIVAGVFFAARGGSNAFASQIPRNPTSGSASDEKRDWPAYGGAAENTHYSSLAQINRTNVKELSIAWSFDTGEDGGLQTSPIIVEGILYGITPTQKVFSLDAASGKLLWKFDSGIKGTQPDRGLAFWSSEKDKRV
ncbi:MAG TPA: PQQ-binding-like beta-propeller repeat protein, partial [Candidatus Acidoferrum sp.]